MSGGEGFRRRRVFHAKENPVPLVCGGEGSSGAARLGNHWHTRERGRAGGSRRGGGRRGDFHSRRLAGE